MSFYRTLLAAVAAVVIASPVFAEDAAQPAENTSEAMQLSDNSSAAATDNSAQATQQTSSDQTTAAADPTDVKVNLNKATVKDLMKLKGMNASKARSIVAYRKKHGDFKSTDDLANVKGFKKLKSDKLKEITDQLTVE